MAPLVSQEAEEHDVHETMRLPRTIPKESLTTEPHLLVEANRARIALNCLNYDTMKVEFIECHGERDLHQLGAQP